MNNFYDWRDNIRPKDKTGETPQLYKEEIDFMNYMNNFHEYSRKMYLM